MDEAFNEIPNPDAVTLVKVLYRMWHLVDDLVDRDQERTAADVALTLFAYTDHVGSNPFYQAHKVALIPIIYSSAKAWAASERFKTSEDINNKLAAETLKSEYFNVFAYIAFLAGGVEFAHRWDEKWRGYHFG